MRDKTSVINIMISGVSSKGFFEIPVQDLLLLGNGLLEYIAPSSLKYSNRFKKIYNPDFLFLM